MPPPSQKQFLHELLKLEVASTWRSRIARLTKQAGFPQLKTLEGFRWDNTNLPGSLARSDLQTAKFARWGEILADTQMAAALIERIVHHGHHITFEGISYRLENSLMRQGGKTPPTAATAA